MNEVHFPEIARIDNEELIIFREVLEEIFSSLETSSFPIALHIVISRKSDTCRNILIGELASYCKSDNISLNPHLDTIQDTFIDLFKNAREASNGEKQLVIFSQPIFSTSNEGKKSKIANFFLDIWIPESRTKELIVLSGLAAAWASTVMYYTDTELTVTDMNWLKNVASVTLKTEKVEQIQSLFYLAKSWERSSPYQVGLQKNEDLLESIFNKLDTELVTICKKMTENYSCILLPKSLDLQSANMKLNLNKACRVVLDGVVVKRLNGLSIRSDQATEMFSELLSYQDFIDFEDNLVFEKLDCATRTLSTSTSNTEDDPHGSNFEECPGSGNEMNDSNIEMEPDTELPWKIKPIESSSASLNTLVQNIVLDEDSAMDELECPEPIYSPEPTPTNIFATSIQEKRALPTAEETLNAIFSRNKVSNTPAKKPSSLKPNGNTTELNIASPKEENLLENIPSHNNVAPDNLVAKLIEALIGAKICKETTATSIYEKAVRLSGKRNMSQIVNHDQSLFTQLQFAVEIIHNFQHILNQMLQTELFFLDDAVFDNEMKKCCARLDSQNLGELAAPLIQKLEKVVSEFKEINANIKLNETRLLEEMSTLTEDYVRSIISNLTAGERNMEAVQKIQQLVVLAIEQSYGHPNHPLFIQKKHELISFIEKFCSSHFMTPSPRFPFSRGIDYGITPKRFDTDSCDTPKNSKNNLVPLQPKILDKNEVNVMHSANEGRQKMYKTPSPVHPLVQHNQGTAFRAKEEIRSHTELAVVTVVFDWDKISVTSDTGAYIIEPLNNEIWISATEIILGGEIGEPNGSKPIKVMNIVENFLTQKSGKMDFPVSVEKIFALIFLKLHTMICASLKIQEVVMGILLPPFFCSHLAQVLLEAVSLSGLKLVLGDHAAALICYQSSSNGILNVHGIHSKALVVVNTDPNLFYSTVTSYKVNEKELRVTDIEHGWDTGPWGFKTASYQNALKKVSVKNSHVFICPCDKSSEILKEMRAKFEGLKLYEAVEKTNLFKGMNILAKRATSSSKPINDSGHRIQMVVSGCLLKSVAKRMKANCTHAIFHPSCVDFEASSRYVIELAKSDKHSLAEYKKSVKEQLYDRMARSLSEAEKDKIADQIIQLDKLVTKKQVQDMSSL